MVDYDKPEHLEYLKSYCEKKPDKLFRLIKTARGFHAFLTSHEVPFNSSEAAIILKSVNSDPFHILGALIRGYSCRLNRKHRDDSDEYVELGTIGNGKELEKQKKLYDLHLELFKKHKDSCLYNSGRRNAQDFIGYLTE